MRCKCHRGNCGRIAANLLTQHSTRSHSRVLRWGSVEFLQFIFHFFQIINCEFLKHYFFSVLFLRMSANKIFVMNDIDWVDLGQKWQKTQTKQRRKKRKKKKQNEKSIWKSKTHYGENSMWDFRLNSLTLRMDKQIERSTGPTAAWHQSDSSSCTRRTHRIISIKQ